ncbi:dihydrodipicolinate synthase family protein [Microlunatus soli]|uniref:dihydrodipicolinate synthase family protein n=1 Tax=Microlunatus soli TaxID=630515 RepID=UPI0012F8DFCB|nr:dihydrodipicolinate synthase family protein [Microlunatus soli]
MPTPFDDHDRVDPDAFADVLSRLPAGHADVLVAGTTGEFPALDRDERRTLTEVAVRAVGADKVITHVGAASLTASDRLAEDAASVGVTRVALLTPYYLPADAEQVVAHFHTFAERHPQLSIYPYLFPDRTGVTVEPETFARLMAPANIVGVKLSGRANDHFDAFRSRLRDDQELYTGDDSRLPTIRDDGGTGVVSGCFPAVPDLLLQAIDEPGRVAEIVGLLGPSIARQKYALQLITGRAWRSRMSMPDLSAPLADQIERLVGRS